MLAAEHFRAAADLGSSEGALRLVGAELQRLVGTFADKSGIQLGASSGAPPAGQRRLMTAWEDLPVGSLIWVIDDARELERLCERPAPGVDDAVGFNVEMIALCGKTYRVCGVYASQLSFQVFDTEVNGEDEDEDDDEGGYLLPFDACALVRRGHA